MYACYSLESDNLKNIDLLEVVRLVSPSEEYSSLSYRRINSFNQAFTLSYLILSRVLQTTMSDYKCKETSSCENFQSAICLHCNRRLCVQHIIEHNKIILNDVNNLSNMTEDVFQQIKDKSEKSRNTCNDLLPIFDKWRTEELEKIEQIYQHELQLIKHEEEPLEDFHRDLLEQLEHNARQPLVRVQRQQNTNIETLSLIRETIEKVRKENTQSKWNFSSSSTITSEYCLSDFPPLLFPDQILTADVFQDKKEQTIASSSINLGKKNQTNFDIFYLLYSR